MIMNCNQNYNRSAGKGKNTSIFTLRRRSFVCLVIEPGNVLREFRAEERNY